MSTKLPTPDTIAADISDIQSNIQDMRRIRQQLAQWKVRAEQTPAPSVLDHALTAAENSTTIPEDTFTTLEQQIRDTLVAERMVNLIGRANTSLPTEVQLRERTVPQVLAYLSETMQDLTEYARDLDPSTLVASADQAINLGGKALTQYKHTRALVDAYGAIRQHQLRAYTDSGHSGLSEVTCRSGHFADALDAEAHWLRERARVYQADGSKISRSGDRDLIEFFAAVPASPWEPIKAGAWPENVRNLTDQVRFVTSALRDHDAWVPTVEEVIEADNLNHAALKLTAKPATRRGRRIAA